MAPAAAVVLGERNDAAPVKKAGAAKKAPAKAAEGRSVEEIYQKKSQLEHILLRPDTYVGSTEKMQSTQPVLVEGDGELTKDRMRMETLTYVPGLYKIFDEILVNAADNYRRDGTQNTIRVDIDAEQGTLRVYNNGAGVPVEMHKEEGVYVPELIFGHLLTSSNYDDDERKVTGGRNGYGAKLANIFSTEFVIETCDGSRKLRYRQVFRNNMMEKEAPKIGACKATDNWTCITFRPDLAKFHMEHLEEDTVKLMKRRVYDIAASLGKSVKVFLNGARVPIRGFEDYVKMYMPEDAQCVYARVNERWEVCVCSSEGQFQQMSFVNSIATTRGGTHIGHITDQVTAKLLEHIKKKHKGTKLKGFQIKNHLWVFANALIENPAFDSQTKETLTSRPSTFGSKCEFDDAFFKKLVKTSILENILSWATFKQSKDLKKTDGSKRQRLTGIPKLDDANDAGGRNSQQCTLILTEGDSAKALAISGLSVVGRDKFGVFPLRGKLLNVRDASHDQIMKNAEIQHIKQILGLQQGKTYADTKSLRYGHLMIMTDQDHDGSHIKGLLINFLHHFFPTLLKLPGFLVEFVTPIVKATKGKAVKVFHTMPEYEQWKEAQGAAGLRGWAIKYYKGLGTSTAKEAKEYFAAIDSNKKSFYYTDDQDDDAITMAFSKKRVEDRKAWLKSHRAGTFLDHSESSIGYRDFVNKELVLFSLADLQRSIPSVMDGLKPGQRKIVFCAFKRNLKKDIKVAQLAGYVSEHSAYHHGEASLTSTIVGLAQDFCGSNNINLLFPSGQFGTRLQGGKDAASPRYIYTRMSPMLRHLFPEADDGLLSYLTEEGQSIEPEWYLPILPTVLVNGSEGIGTGWSSFIPNYSPRDIVDNLRRVMAGEAPAEMKPWYRGFGGTVTKMPIKKDGVVSYTITGTYNVVDECTLEVTELPIRKWTQDYKEFLESMVKPEKKDEAAFITDYREYHTDTTVHFVITMPAENLAQAQREGIEKKFKLSTTVSTGNMMLFDADNKIRKYESAEEILGTFCEHRLDLYAKRRVALLAAAEDEMLRASNKMRFITAVIDGDLVLSNRKKAAIEEDLRAQGFEVMAAKGGRKGGKSAAPAPAEEEEEEHDDEEAGGGDSSAAAGRTKGAKLGYEYLLNMPLWNLTNEKVNELREDLEKKRAEVERLTAQTAADMWSDDLDVFIEALDEDDEKRAAEEAQLARQQKASVGRAKKAAAKAKKPAAKKPVWEGESDSDADGFDDENDLDFDDDDEAVVRKPAAKAKAPARPRKAPSASASMMSIDESAGGVAKKSVKSTATSKAAGGKKKLGAKVTPAMPAATKAAAAPAAVDDVGEAQDAGSDGEDDSMLPLSERLAKFRLKETKGKAPATKPAAAAKKPATKAVPAKRAQKKKPEPAAEETIDLCDEDEGPSSSSPAAALPAAKVRRHRPSPFHKGSGKTKSRVEHDDDDADDSDAASDDGRPTAAASRSRRDNKKKVVYVDESEEEEEESDSDESFADDEDDDDGWSP